MPELQAVVYDHALAKGLGLTTTLEWENDSHTRWIQHFDACLL